MKNLKHRSEETELMDDLECDGEVVHQTLRELDIINRKLGGNHVSISGLKQLLKSNRSEETISLVDLGCGGGDILIFMAKWARKNNIKMSFLGVDANPHIISYAEEHCKEYPEISFAALNIFEAAFQTMSFDIVHTSLFTHHFTQEQLVALFSNLKSKISIGMIINDLHRHWLAFYSIKLITRFFSKSAMVRNDAAISVARGFRKPEIKAFIDQSGYQKYSINWKWAFRWQILIRS